MRGSREGQGVVKVGTPMTKLSGSAHGFGDVF